MIIVGVIVIGTPLMATLAMNIFIGWTLVFIGVAEIVHAFSSQGWGGFLWQLLIGVFTAVAGFYLAFFPLRGAVTLTLILAVWISASGVLRIIIGFGLRPAQGSGLIIVGGVLALLLGMMIYAEWPESSAWVIGTLVGIHLIFDGWGMLGAAAAAKEAAG
jgi:uncharacterized membrane protein HdeD (DUF308 family)